MPMTRIRGLYASAVGGFLVAVATTSGFANPACTSKELNANNYRFHQIDDETAEISLQELELSTSGEGSRRDCELVNRLIKKMKEEDDFVRSHRTCLGGATASKVNSLISSHKKLIAGYAKDLKDGKCERYGFHG
ncbi:MAG: hypothetical protein EOR69_26505 [Mesorhizobium sp.]|nr:MAG: hypothetical protein EOR69_26505 [Mesorhizobium sp.]RWL95360.1 MAG: hypothetical protein EOR70_22620 [Mesorhizobium sp.]